MDKINVTSYFGPMTNNAIVNDNCFCLFSFVLKSILFVVIDNHFVILFTYSELFYQPLFYRARKGLSSMMTHPFSSLPELLAVAQHLVSVKCIEGPLYCPFLSSVASHLL